MRAPRPTRIVYNEGRNVKRRDLLQTRRLRFYALDFNALLTPQAHAER